CARVQPDRPGVYGAGHAGSPEPVVARHACGSAAVRPARIHRSMVYIGSPGPGTGESDAVWAPEATLGATVYPSPGCDGPPDVWLGPGWSHSALWAAAVPVCHCGGVGVCDLSVCPPPSSATTTAGHGYTGHWRRTAVECWCGQCPGQSWLARLRALLVRCMGLCAVGPGKFCAAPLECPLATLGHRTGPLAVARASARMRCSGGLGPAVGRRAMG